MIAAVIVLYHPDLLLLNRLIASLLDQVDVVWAIDNTPGPQGSTEEFFSQHAGRINYEPLGDNKGIALAHNIGIQRGLSAGASHILLLDQDSALPSGMIERLLQAEHCLIHRGEKVAAVGPIFLDEKSCERSSPFRQRYLGVKTFEPDRHSYQPVETEYIIASGSLIRRSVIEDVGMMLEELFIDLVDVEWGLRAKSKGYKSYVVPAITISHSVGDRTAKIFGRNIYIHGSARNYYRLRNAVYLLRKPYMGSRWRISTLLSIPKHFLIYLFSSECKLRTLTLMFRAGFDGIFARIGRYS